jgi:rod shape-determining protein MreD
MFSVLAGIAIVIASVMQTSPLFFSVGSGWRVDLALLVVAYFSLFWDAQRALLVGFITGLCQDALSSELLGLSALSKSLSAFAVYTLCRNVQAHSVIAQTLFVCLAVLVDTSVRLLVMVVFQLNSFSVHTVLITLMQQLVLSVVLIPFVCLGLEALARSLRLYQEGP